MAHFNECRAGGSTAQGLYADTAGARKKIQETCVFHACRENVEERRLHTVDNGTGTRCFGRFEFASFSLTSHYAHKAPPRRGEPARHPPPRRNNLLWPRK